MKICTAGILAATCVLSFACSKKSKEPQSTPTKMTTETSMVERVKDQTIERIDAVKQQAGQHMAMAQEKAEQQLAAVKKQASAQMETYKEISINATRPLTEIKAEAENLNLEQLKATALKYKEAISAKTAELQPLVEKFKQLPLSKKLSTEGLQIKEDIASVSESLDSLKVRYDVYVSKLKGMGVDLSSFLK